MITPEGCKPFDLERALAGDPVVTRRGRTVTQLVKFDVGDRIYTVYGVVGDGIGSWRVDGRHWNSGESEYDLFMAQKKSRTVWVNLYPGNIVYCHDSKEGADSSQGGDRIGNRAWPVEIEEPVEIED